jgi:GNAT superfamily N-acetyltransferase
MRGTARRAAKPSRGPFVVRPLTPSRWGDLEALFGPRGACAGCWCMWWRLPAPEWTRGKGEGNRRALQALVRKNAPIGVLAYRGHEPAGWCAVAPRADLVRLERSRVLAPVDQRPVWSITCFYVARPFRRSGLSARLLEGAARFARSRGAAIVEGYPVDLAAGKTIADAWAFTGLASSFRAAGFREVARRSRTRPIMRRVLRPARASR